MILTIFYLYGTVFILKFCITGNPTDSICLIFLYSIRKRCFDLSFYRKSGYLSCRYYRELSVLVSCDHTCNRSDSERPGCIVIRIYLHDPTVIRAFSG